MKEERGPVISVALCTYNGSRYLGPLLDSLLAQELPAREIICVDDCSTDDTVRILQRYAAAHPWISVVTNSANLGYTRNFEKAISLCAGGLIALCDQDDIWHPAKLRILSDRIGDELLLYHDSELIFADGRRVGKRISDLKNFYAGSDPRYLLLENCVSGHAVMIRKTLMQYIPAFPAEIPYDWWLAYHAASNGSLAFVPDVLVYYRQHEATATSITHAPRTGRERRNAAEKFDAQSREVALFHRDTPDPYRRFTGKLAGLLADRVGFFTVRLFFFVFRHRRILFYLRKKGPLSQAVQLLKFLWGTRLKKLVS